MPRARGLPRECAIRGRPPRPGYSRPRAPDVLQQDAWRRGSETLGATDDARVNTAVSHLSLHPGEDAALTSVLLSSVRNLCRVVCHFSFHGKSMDTRIVCVFGVGPRFLDRNLRTRVLVLVSIAQTPFPSFGLDSNVCVFSGRCHGLMHDLPRGLYRQKKSKVFES
jgi:hypothetical protein